MTPYFSNEKVERNELKNSIIELIEKRKELPIKELLNTPLSLKNRTILVEILKELQKDNIIDIVQKYKKIDEANGLLWDTYITLK